MCDSHYFCTALLYAFTRRERFQPSQDFKDAFERRLQGTGFNFDAFWDAVKYCCSSRSRVLDMRDPIQTLISFLLDKAIKEDDAMYALQFQL
jgi:hypothetical protein